MFKRNWFKWYDKLPETLSNYMASDYAGAPDPESGREPDYTEHGIGGLDKTGDLYLHDWYSAQVDAEAWIDAAVQLVRRHKPRYWFEEKGVILRSLDGAISKRLKERQVYVLREPLASAGNKASRALGFAARCSSGAVWLPQNQPWAERLVNQLCGFTGEQGKVDDGVDVCSLLARGLDLMRNARESKTEPKPEVKPFRRKWREQLPEGDAELERKRRSWYQ
jgi:predicted phage terminase large subunit-like protein